MKLSIVAAMGKNRSIGFENQLPWHLPADLKHFREVTWGKPILMGRKTFESLKRPLPGRLNIVLTHSMSYVAEGCSVVHSLREAFQVADAYPELMVIGGRHLFEQTLPEAEFLYLTFIDYTFKGDVFFPKVEEKEWETVKEETYQADEKNSYAYRFITLKRRHSNHHPRAPV